MTDGAIPPATARLAGRRVLATGAGKGIGQETVFCRPGDVAGVISFLLGDDAAMLNGISIDVDGGLRVA